MFLFFLFPLLTLGDFQAPRIAPVVSHMQVVLQGCDLAAMISNFLCCVYPFVLKYILDCYGAAIFHSEALSFFDLSFYQRQSESLEKSQS